jgi:hypothetical protein
MKRIDLPYPIGVYHHTDDGGCDLISLTHVEDGFWYGYDEDGSPWTQFEGYLTPADDMEHWLGNVAVLTHEKPELTEPEGELVASLERRYAKPEA